MILRTFKPFNPDRDDEVPEELTDDEDELESDMDDDI